MDEFCPKRTNDVTYIHLLWIGSGITTILILLHHIYDSRKTDESKLIYFSSKGHLLSSYCHQIYIILDWVFMNDLMSDLICFVTTMICTWTTVITCLSFSKLYIIKKEEIYNKKGLTIFVCVATTVIRAYEEVIILILYTIEVFSYLAESSCGYYPIKLAFRLSSTLVLLTAPCVLFVVAIRSLCTKSSLPKIYYLLFTFHVSVFVFSDVILIFYEYAMYLPSDLLKDIVTLLIPVRLVIELLWIGLSNKYFYNVLYTE